MIDTCNIKFHEMNIHMDIREKGWGGGYAWMLIDASSEEYIPITCPTEVLHVCAVPTKPFFTTLILSDRNPPWVPQGYPEPPQRPRLPRLLLGCIA